jgi:ferredoxin, 2Fe-2S
MSDVNIKVTGRNGDTSDLTAPTDMNLSLMEFLKGSGYDIAATCGGIALCATCHVEVIKGFENTGSPTDDEHAMLDTLHDLTPTSRLSCQVRLNKEIEGCEFRLLGEGEG